MDVHTIYAQNTDRQMTMGQNVNFFQVAKVIWFAREKND